MNTKPGDKPDKFIKEIPGDKPYKFIKKIGKHKENLSVLTEVYWPCLYKITEELLPYYYSKDIYRQGCSADDNWLDAEKTMLELFIAAYYESINNNYRSKEGHWYYVENKLNWIRKRAYDIFAKRKSNHEHNWYLAEEEYKIIELMAYYNYLDKMFNSSISNWEEAEKKYLSSKNKVNLQDKVEQVRCLAYKLSNNDNTNHEAEYYWYKAEHQYRHKIIENL